MALTWQPLNTDLSLYGFDSANRLRGQVVRYDVPAGWAAFMFGHRVDGGPWDETRRRHEGSGAGGQLASRQSLTVLNALPEGGRWAD